MSLKLYDIEAINQHNVWEDDAKDIWVVYENFVYDVTKFVEEHPGGEDLILDFAGTDMTVEFDKNGHSEGARNILNEYKIGQLVCVSSTF